MTSSTFDQVRNLASDLFSVPASNLTAESSPETIAAWDSIQHLNLVLALEEKFSFQLSAEEMEQMHSIGEIASLVERKLQTPAS